MGDVFLHPTPAPVKRAQAWSLSPSLTSLPRPEGLSQRCGLLGQVLAEAPQRMMANAVREVSRRADVLCIEGSPQMVKGLEQISATRARAVIILADDDKSFATQQEDCDANAVRRPLPLVCTRVVPLSTGVVAFLPLEMEGLQAVCYRTSAMSRCALQRANTLSPHPCPLGPRSPQCWQSPQRPPSWVPACRRW